MAADRLMVFKAANPAAIWVIFISSIWPMIINTAVGVQRVPQDYLNVARVLNLSSGSRYAHPLSGDAALHADRRAALDRRRVARHRRAEMLTGGVGIGFWVWDEWNNLNVEHIIIAIFVVGIVGCCSSTAAVARAPFNTELTMSDATAASAPAHRTASPRPITCTSRASA
jgi:nitrate/nitrite transport system permease protein